MSRNVVAVLFSLALVTFVYGCKGDAPKPSQDVQFSARLIISGAGGSNENLVNFTRDMQRVEVGEGGTVVILRPDKSVSWVLLPTSSLFLERRLEPGNKNPLIYEPDRIEKWKKVGEETLDGHPVVKERFVMTNEGDRPMDVYRWFATDIGWPIKAAAVDGSWTLQYKDLVVGPQDPGLFEVPRGYTMIQGQQPHAAPPAEKAE